MHTELSACCGPAACNRAVEAAPLTPAGDVAAMPLPRLPEHGCFRREVGRTNVSGAADKSPGGGSGGRLRSVIPDECQAWVGFGRGQGALPLPLLASEAPVMSSAVVLWDFDQTLAFRPGRWSGLLVEILDEHLPGHNVTLDALRQELQHGFPWHTPEEPHHHLNEPEAWWSSTRTLLCAAVHRAGVAIEDAEPVAVAAATRYRDPTIGWTLFGDTVEALATVRACRWRNAVFSNHIPELSALISGLGLGAYIDATFSSALTGYEKPHPEAYKHAIRSLGHPKTVWMIGDSVRADVHGAEAVGIPAVLVHSDDPDVTRSAPDLLAAVKIVLSGQTS